MQCARHPNIETNLTCGKCGTPICPKCLVQTPVGIRCKKCARLNRIPTYQMSTSYYLRAIGAAAGIAIVCGFIWGAINFVLPFIVLRFVIAGGVGYAIGEVISVSVNRKRGTGLAVIGGCAAAVSSAIAALVVPLFLPAGMGNILFGFIAMAIAIATSVMRLR